jgi:thioredoxin reductase (NADPH)
VATECQGDGDLLQSLAIKNVKTGETSTLDVNGLFYAIGHEPATALVREQVHTDADGYIVTVPGTAQTSIKGVFAAGDVQDKKYRQAITSAGSGESWLSFRISGGRPLDFGCQISAVGRVADQMTPRFCFSGYDNTGCMAALEAERLISEEEAEDNEIPAGEKHVPSEALTGYL